MHVSLPFDLCLAVCRHAELGCTARLSEVTRLSQAVVWLDLQSSLRVLCGLLSRIRVRIPRPSKLGVAIAVFNKMVDDTDNQKERGNAENKTTFSFTRYT